MCTPGRMTHKFCQVVIQGPKFLPFSGFMDPWGLLLVLAIEPSASGQQMRGKPEGQPVEGFMAKLSVFH